jgi:hypothetical protein
MTYPKPASGGDLAPCQHARQGRKGRNVGWREPREWRRCSLFGAATGILASVEQFPSRSWPHAGRLPASLGFKNRTTLVKTRVVKCYYLGRSPAFRALCPARSAQRTLWDGNRGGQSGISTTPGPNRHTDHHHAAVTAASAMPPSDRASGPSRSHAPARRNLAAKRQGRPTGPRKDTVLGSIGVWVTPPRDALRRQPCYPVHRCESQADQRRWPRDTDCREPGARPQPGSARAGDQCRQIRRSRLRMRGALKSLGKFGPTRRIVST